jgi:hypoxanthine phosphoribosyltransferase
MGTIGLSAPGERLDLLISEARLRRRVRELARRIERDYAGRSVTLLVVLKGAAIFAADLLRELALPATIEFIGASSYGAETRSSGRVALRGLGRIDLRGRDVILLEDIVDSGLTARKLMNRLRRRGPVSLALCTLLRKRIANGVPVTIAYQGFEIPDRFVVGYGMDYAERYRNLRGVYILSFGCDARPAGH